MNVHWHMTTCVFDCSDQEWQDFITQESMIYGKMETVEPVTEEREDDGAPFFKMIDRVRYRGNDNTNTITISRFELSS